MSLNDSSYIGPGASSSSSGGSFSGSLFKHSGCSQNSSQDYWNLVAQHAADQNTNFDVNNNSWNNIQQHQDKNTPQRWTRAGPIPAEGLPTVLTDSFFAPTQTSSTNPQVASGCSATGPTDPNSSSYGYIMNFSTSAPFIMDPNISSYPVADISSPMITGNLRNYGNNGTQLFAIDEFDPNVGVGEPLLASTLERRRRVVSHLTKSSANGGPGRSPGRNSGSFGRSFSSPVSRSLQQPQSFSQPQQNPQLITQHTPHHNQVASWETERRLLSPTGYHPQMSSGDQGRMNQMQT